MSCNREIETPQTVSSDVHVASAQEKNYFQSQPKLLTQSRDPMIEHSLCANAPSAPLRQRTKCQCNPPHPAHKEVYMFEHCLRRSEHHKMQQLTPALTCKARAAIPNSPPRILISGRGVPESATTFSCVICFLRRATNGTVAIKAIFVLKGAHHPCILQILMMRLALAHIAVCVDA
jgi:hypothetical protein